MVKLAGAWNVWVAQEVVRKIGFHSAIQPSWKIGCAENSGGDFGAALFSKGVLVSKAKIFAHFYGRWRRAWHLPQVTGASWGPGILIARM